MSIRSMTGYGTSPVKTAGRSYVIEIKTLNHRYFDLSFRSPKVLSRLETKLQQYLREHLHRGRIEISVNADSSTQESAFYVNAELAEQVHRRLKDLAGQLGLSQPPSLQDLFSFREIFEEPGLAADLDTLWKEFLPGLDKAVKAVIESRKQEGKSLLQDLQMRLGLLREQHSLLKEEVKSYPEDYRRKMQARIQEALKGADLKDEISQTRLLQEVAFWAERSDIQEEISRFDSHLNQLQADIQSSAKGPVGRKMDFLIQELHREMNTIGSKCNHEKATAIVVGCKAEIERIREQVQNVE